jgi:hypothetical protein
MLSHGGTPWADVPYKKSNICGVLKIPCRERAVTVPKFAEGKSKFVFGESIQYRINQAPLDSKERSKPVPYKIPLCNHVELCRIRNYTKG